MRAFVTGATGFVGANLVAGLNRRGIAVSVLKRASSLTLALEGLDYETIAGDVMDSPASLARAMAGCDWVFHVAAVSDYWRQGQERLYSINVDGTKNVLAAAQAAGVKRFVFTSSLAALGLPSDGQLLNESFQFNVQPHKFPYGHSKHLAENEVRKAVESGLPAVIVNPAITLGPRDIYQNSGSIIVEAAKGLLLAYPPGGTNFVAVEDVVCGHIAAAERGQPGERYILAGENITYREAATTVCEVVGKRAPVLGIPKRSMPLLALAVSAARVGLGNRVPIDSVQVRLMGLNIFADGSKAEQEFGLPRTPFRTAAQRTYDWYNSKGYL